MKKKTDRYVLMGEEQEDDEWGKDWFFVTDISKKQFVDVVAREEGVIKGGKTVYPVAIEDVMAILIEHDKEFYDDVDYYVQHWKGEHPI